MEKAGTDNDVARLQRLRSAHHRDQTALARTRQAALARTDRHESAAAACQTAIDGRSDTRGDAFAMTVDGHQYTKRTEAGAQVKLALARLINQPPTRPVNVGRLGGFDLTATRDAEAGITLHVAGAPITIELTAVDVAETEGARLVQRLEHRLARLDADRDQHLSEAATARAEADRAAARLGAPFDQQPLLDTLLARQTELEALLTPTPEPTSTAPDPVTPAERLQQLGRSTAPAREL